MNDASRVGKLPKLSAGSRLGIVALIAIVAAVPVVYTNHYVLTFLVTALITLVLNTSWNFVLGIAGVWNFGMLAIYAIGAYSEGLVMLHTGMPAPIAVLLGGVAAGAFSVLLAFPTLRLFGIYTSLLTFSFAQVVQFVIVNDPKGLTGGSFGFPTVKGLYPNLGPLAQLRAYYWTVLAVVVVATFAVAWIRSSRLGIALRTIRDAPAYAAARGVSPLKYRMLAFAISGFIAGVAGGLYLSYNQSITSSVMGLTPMSIDVTMLVIGGLGTLFGPVIGTGLLTFIQQALIDYPGVQLSILGTILLIIVVFVPGGLVGLISRTRRRLSNWVEEDETALPTTEEAARSTEAGT
ncbi:MAG: branched-chain amino acid ABC transporter permease [Actinobacteria bacterium]|nr:branched-chain amino acid ABC transporter permease [Actinomycetota bacterium]